jgi:hypothetical protein
MRSVCSVNTLLLTCHYTDDRLNGQKTNGGCAWNNSHNEFHTHSARHNISCLQKAPRNHRAHDNIIKKQSSNFQIHFFLILVLSIWLYREAFHAKMASLFYSLVLEIVAVLQEVCDPFCRITSMHLSMFTVDSVRSLNPQ